MRSPDGDVSGGVADSDGDGVITEGHLRWRRPLHLLPHSSPGPHFLLYLTSCLRLLMRAMKVRFYMALGGSLMARPPLLVVTQRCS